jgi:pyruvate/oxaloacetate carboxyltransferase
MRMNPISRFVRQLSGQGALDNVSQVLAARASIDAELTAFAERVTPMSPIGAETPAAA